MKGASMNIEYFEPLSRAWNRMTRALFEPFDLGKWFGLGFTAFLAGLINGHMSGSGSRFWGGRDVGLGDVVDFPNTSWNWLMDHAVWLFLIILGITVVSAIIILSAWLSSRGKFMFLDNVVHERARVTQPWHRFKMEGDSLFLWRLAFGIICLAVIILFLVRAFFIAAQICQEGFYAGLVMTIVRMALLMMPVAIIITYISLFLTDFVVPIMYINNVTASQAWRLFLPLFVKHWFCFILYGLLVLVLRFFVTIIVVIAGLFTCCLGFILLAIPYIGSVVTLPISYTFRAFSLEFLEQLGPDYTIFPRPEYTAVSESI
jgi:MFS family permease